MAFLDKLNQVAKNIGDKTNDAIEITKLNSKISTEKSAATEDIKKIGEYYYNVFVNGGEVAQEVLELCQSAQGHYKTIAEAQAEIENIKAENAAEKAGVAPAQNVAPVQNVAPEAPAAEGATRFCTACGAPNAAGTKFCCQCGNKMETL